VRFNVVTNAVNVAGTTYRRSASTRLRARKELHDGT
jgi:hypothetical protein